MDEQRSPSYLSPKLAPLLRPDAGGQGIEARLPVAAGEVLAIWGGEVFDGAGFARLSDDLRRRSVQIEEDAFMVPSHVGAADRFNHGCDPNAGISGQIVLVALRDIAVGEEVCYDYATTDGSPYDEFDCRCGAASCRGRITGDDWCNPTLWARYQGYFAPYLQRRISALQARRSP